LRLACNDLRLDLKDLRLDLGLEAWWLATCTSAHCIHRSKTKPSVNSLINNSEHLLLITYAQRKIIRILSLPMCTAMVRLLGHDHNKHDWPMKHWAIWLLEWMANFHWLSWLFMPALHSRCRHYIFVLWLLPFFPRLISAVADWMSTILPHMMWP